MLPTISVIIPAFNVAKTLGRAINSVIAQTISSSEIIIVDDASSDDTLDVIKQYSFASPVPIKLISLKVNVGAAVARNVGWEKAAGEYIAFLDADDIWHPRKTEIQLNLMRKHGYQCIGGRIKIIRDLPRNFTDAELNVDTEQVRRNTILYGNPFNTSSVMLSSNIQLRMNDAFRYGEDYLLWCQIVLSGYKSGLISEPLCFCYKELFGESGLSSDLYKMETAELSSYKFLLDRKQISMPEFLMVTVWSVIKFIRRVIITKFIRRFRHG